MFKPPPDPVRHQHLTTALGTNIQQLATIGSTRSIATTAVTNLEAATALHSQILGLGIEVKDSANLYQRNWSHALTDLMRERASDYDYLEMLGK
jgi:hypothetical protein